MQRIRHTVLSSFLAACAAPATATSANAPPAAPSLPVTASVTQAAQPGSVQESETRERPLKTQPWGPEIFQERRQRLMAQMKSGVALILGPRRFDPSGSGRDSDFMYLTGLTEETGG